MPTHPLQSSRARGVRSSALALAAILAASASASAPRDDAWLRPPPAVEAVALAAPLPRLDYAPDGRWLLMLEREALPPLALVARPMERLAGIRIDPAARGRFTSEVYTRVVLRPLAPELAERGDLAVALPADGRLTAWSWSLEGHRIAFVVEGAAGSRLFVAEPSVTGAALVLATARLDTTFVAPAWQPGGGALLVALVPEGEPPAPARPDVAAGPAIAETSGATSPRRTAQDLLRDAADAERFAHFARTRLALARADGGGATFFDGLGPDLWISASFAPNMQRLLTERLVPPFSYLTTWRDFPRIIEVHGWGTSGGAPVHRRNEIARLPLAEGIPIDGVRTGPREFRWMASEPASLAWVEALDGGDPRVAAEHRDRWMRLDFPLEVGAELPQARELARLEHRASGIAFVEGGGRVVLRERDRDRRWVRARVFDLQGRAAPVVLEDRSASDAYADPGELATRRDATGSTVVRRDGEWLYRIGAGATPEGDRPFLDRQRLSDGLRERLWSSGTDFYEEIVAILDVGPRAGDEPLVAVVQRESADEAPSHTITPIPLPGGPRGERAPRVVVRLADPQPAMRAVKKELVHYERADGVALSAFLYLPPDLPQDRPPPLLVWAYPREFTDARLAGQVRGSAQRFTTVAGASHLSLVLAGYAVLDGAAMPILGDPETMNDTFVEQLVAGATAAVEFAVARGVADRSRIAIGGHSYGAFMTANLLAHSDLFAAGVARSGAFNRTLTPFGFQSERRTLWEAGDTYAAVSPLLHAGGIGEPLLLIHGLADANSGTYPDQSIRLFAALEGLGGTARLVLLPHEDHAYRSREAVLHVLAETHAWLERHLVDR